MRKLFLFLPLLLLCLIFTSCSEGIFSSFKSTADIFSDAPEEGINPAASHGQNKSIYKVDDSTAVVLDSVVDVFREANIRSERFTQVLYNEPVKILENIQDWSRVQLIDGYTGYIQTKYLSTDCSSLFSDDINLRLVVSSKTKEILSDIKNGITVKNVVLGTELFCISKEGSWYKVKLPGGKSGWISSIGTFQLKASGPIPLTSAIDFVLTLKKFTGTSFLSGGVSALGVDSPGLLYISGKINGLNLKRELTDLYLSDSGKTLLFSSMTIEDLEVGDILFFSTAGNNDKISRAGVFMGKELFIQVSIDNGSVITASFENGHLKEHLLAIKRFF